MQGGGDVCCCMAWGDLRQCWFEAGQLSRYTSTHADSSKRIDLSSSKVPQQQQLFSPYLAILCDPLNSEAS